MKGGCGGLEFTVDILTKVGEEGEDVRRGHVTEQDAEDLTEVQPGQQMADKCLDL